MSKEVIVKLTSDHIKVKGGEYVRDYQRGEWIQTSKDWIDGTCGARYFPIHCSICNYSTYDDRATNFCPNCGADMRQAENEDEKL